MVKANLTDLEYIVISDGKFHPVRAIFTVGILVGAFWLNAKFIDSSALSAILFIMFFFVGLGWMRLKAETIADARKKLDELEAKQ